MKNTLKIDIWSKELKEEVKNSSLIAFDTNRDDVLRMINHRYDIIFNLLVEGKTIRIANLELYNRTLAQALAEGEDDDEKKKKVNIYTANDYKVQNKKIDILLKEGRLLYLTFGMLNYFDDNQVETKSAPLVLLPIEIEYIQEEKSYQVKNKNHEVYINEPLVETLRKNKNIDISYPINNDFNLIEYLTFVSIKVSHYHYIVNDGSFISHFSINPYFQLRDFKNNSNEISSLPRVKSISYINPEFYNFNKTSSIRLDNHFLSLLDLDNEEYKIMKNLNLRSNAIIRTNSLKNRAHVLQNTLFDYLLNGKNILISYEDENAHQEILDLLKETNLAEFSLDLSINDINKKRTLARLQNYDKFKYDNKLLDVKQIEETVDNYYLIKNNFKKIINSLRKNNEPLNLTINAAINNYFIYGDYPLLEIAIPNVGVISQETLTRYLDSISSFISTLEKLKCNYKDHPFYGFNCLTLSQDDYKELKNKIILLSDEFKYVSRAFDTLTDKYHLPEPDTLKEAKCILNIVKLIPEVKKINEELYEEKNSHDVVESLTHYNELSSIQANLRGEIISQYEDKVFLIPMDLLQSTLSSNLHKKQIKVFKQYFTQDMKIDEQVLQNVFSKLTEYQKNARELQDIIDQHPQYEAFYKEGIYNLEEIQNSFNIINSFNNYCAYLKNQGKDYSYMLVQSIANEEIENVEKYKKGCQIGFNHLLTMTSFLQQYFDKDLVDFSTTSLSILEEKMTAASKNFSLVNDYLDFYLSKRKLNRLIPNLGDALLKNDKISDYTSIFLKRFYYDYAEFEISNNSLFGNFSMSLIDDIMKDYSTYNSVRLEEVFALIKNNLSNRLQSANVSIKANEAPYITHLLNNDIRILNIKTLLNACPNSMRIIFPIMIIKTSDIPNLLENKDYHFDVNILYANKDMLVKNVVSSEVRANQTIVFQQDYLDEKESNLVVSQNYENVIQSSLNCYSHLDYISSTYQSTLLTANKIDISLKKYLTTLLRSHNFLVTQNVVTSKGTIDLVVKVPNSNRPSAIIIDHLNYYSLDSAIDNFEISESILNDLGYASFRIITPIFFLNEKEEIDKLISFIVQNTVNEKVTRKINKIKPLIDVIFSLYENPAQIYQTLPKEGKSNSDIMYSFLEKVVPISKEEVELLIKDNTISSLAELQASKKIRISNGFIFIDTQEIKFRRVDRASGFARKSNYVSNEELAAGVKALISQRSFTMDQCIKLILSSLGLKKMNYSIYFRLENIIKELIDDKVLYQKDNSLFFNNK